METNLDSRQGSVEGSMGQSSDYANLEEHRVEDPDKARAMADAGDYNETVAANMSQLRYDEGRDDREIRKHERRANRAENKAGHEYDKAERKAEREAADILTHAQEVLDGTRVNTTWTGEIGDDKSEIVISHVLSSLGISPEDRQKELEDAQTFARLDRSEGFDPNALEHMYHHSNTGLTIHESRVKGDDGKESVTFQVYKSVPKSERIQESA